MTKQILSLLLWITLAAMIMAAADQGEAATVEAKSASLADVESAIGSAREGDTVIVPPGIASWTSTLFITKGITLKGETSTSGPTASPVVSDKTIILDELPRRSQHQPRPEQHGLTKQATGAVREAAFVRGHRRPNEGTGPNPARMPAIINAVLKPTQSFRLTGFTFKYGSATTHGGNGGVHLTGTCPSARIDHCHFDQLYANPFIMTRGQIYGVVDHCVFDEMRRSLTFQICHNDWGGHTHGDGSWVDAPYFGSEKFLFIEDNTFRNPNGYRSNGIDAYGGGRYVIRYNYLVDTPIGGHGTETSGRSRGVRAIEIYNNTCVWNLVEPRGQLRSGTMLEFDNLWTGNEDRLGKSTRLTCYREFRPFPYWGGASGHNRLDLNDPHGLCANGRHTGPNNSPALVVTNAGWKVNQWVGYSLTNATQTIRNRNGAEFHPSSCITKNTADTIIFMGSDMGTPMTFNPGDSYEIYKLLAALDQPGRGKGDLLADQNPVATGSWPHQALEPVYAWGNTHNHVRQLDVASPYPTIQENRDYYNQRMPFDGSAGVGVGKLEDRPKTCSVGVAYWATDWGEWDSTRDGSDGQLYICTQRDSWELYYKPYAYPHPLVSGSPGKAKADGGRN